RADLRLAERAALWTARPEARLLPSWWEWAGLRLLTRKRDWTPQQAQMMRKAGRGHLLRAAVLLLLLGALGWGAFEGWGYVTAASKVDALASAATAEVPKLVAELGPYRRWADPLLARPAPPPPPPSPP